MDHSKVEILALAKTSAGLGRVLALDMRNDEVVANLEVATTQIPSNLRAYADLAWAYTRAYRIHDAINVLSTILAWSHGDDSLVDWGTTFRQELELQSDVD